jgi:hypothetical protein
MYDVNEPPRPRGAPKKGSRVYFESPFGLSWKGIVVEYLSSQFVIETDYGNRLIIGVNEKWKLLPNTE